MITRFAGGLNTAIKSIRTQRVEQGNRGFSPVVSRSCFKQYKIFPRLADAVSWLLCNPIRLYKLSAVKQRNAFLFSFCYLTLNSCLMQ